MGNPRKHHYVPQTYLNSFSFVTRKSPQIYVLSKNPHKIYSASVEDSAAERDFYTVDRLEDKYGWERHYANNIEPILSGVIRKIRQRCENALIQNGAVVLNPEDKFELALSVIFQFLRGKHTREFERKLYIEFLPQVTEQTRIHFGPLTPKQEELLSLFETENAYFKEIAMETIFQKERIQLYVNLLMQRHFVIYKISGNPSFVTSDNPVMLVDSITHDVTPFRNGLAIAKTLLYYPLSPKLLLGAYHPDLYFGAFESRDCHIQILDEQKDQQFISTQNKKQKEHCCNYVYAQSKEVLQSIFL